MTVTSRLSCDSLGTECTRDPHEACSPGAPRLRGECGIGLALGALQFVDAGQLQRCVDVLDVGSGKAPIGGDQRNLFDRCLSHEQPIDRIPMEIVRWHDPQCMAEFEGEAFDSAREKTVGNVAVG